MSGSLDSWGRVLHSRKLHCALVRIPLLLKSTSREDRHWTETALERASKLLGSLAFGNLDYFVEYLATKVVSEW